MEKITLHNLPPDFQLKKGLETDIGMVHFYNGIVIFEANEGVDEIAATSCEALGTHVDNLIVLKLKVSWLSTCLWHFVIGN